MPARPQIDGDLVKATIRRWAGNVQAAADELGMRPKNLRERLARLGVGPRELDALRQAARVAPSRPVTLGPTRMTRNDTDRTERPGQGGPYGQNVSSGPVTAMGRPNRISRVQMAAATKDDATGAVDVPIRTVRPRLIPTRLTAENDTRLNDACFDFAARWRVTTDKNTVLNQFFEEEFETWCRKKLNPAPAEKAKKGRKE